MLFRKKKENRTVALPDNMEPVLLVSICTGETTAALRNRESGAVTPLYLCQSKADVEQFRQTYGIQGEIPRVY